MSAVNSTAALIRASQNVYARKFSFLVVFTIILFVTVSVFSAIGFIPNPPKATLEVATTPTVTLNNSPLAAVVPLPTKPAPISGAMNMSGELPTKIQISKIGMNVSIANPATTDVEKLDQYLLSGAVRYPTSATLDQEGNVILFGHSSYLPIVHNLSYKAFDGIQNLTQGDQITVYSNTHRFVYAVQTVRQADATSDMIPLTQSGHTLTLATCDSFGKKTDRFVVTATLVGSYALGS